MFHFSFSNAITSRRQIEYIVFLSYRSFLCYITKDAKQCVYAFLMIQNFENINPIVLDLAVSLTTVRIRAFRSCSEKDGDEK